MSILYHYRLAITLYYQEVSSIVPDIIYSGYKYINILFCLYNLIVEDGMS